MDDDLLPPASNPFFEGDICSVNEERATYGSRNSSADGFRDLRVWQLAMDYITASYVLTKTFPKDELYGMTSQIRRAVTSIALNISEGWGRNRKTELARACEIARGSVAESDTAFEIAVRLRYVQPEDVAELARQSRDISAMLLSLIAKLRLKPG